MKRFFAFFLFSSLTILTYSYGLDNEALDPAAPDKRALMAQGQLTSVRVIPAEKSAKLFVLGKKIAEARPKNEMRPRIIRVTAFNKEGEEELKLTPEGDYYTVTNPKLGNPYSLRIDTEYDKRSEKLEVSVPKAHP